MIQSRIIEYDGKDIVRKGLSALIYSNIIGVYFSSFHYSVIMDIPWSFFECYVPEEEIYVARSRIFKNEM